jgi:hypothetical protein
MNRVGITHGRHRGGATLDWPPDSDCHDGVGRNRCVGAGSVRIPARWSRSGHIGAMGGHLNPVGEAASGCPEVAATHSTPGLRPCAQCRLWRRTRRNGRRRRSRQCRLRPGMPGNARRHCPLARRFPGRCGAGKPPLRPPSQTPSSSLDRGARRANRSDVRNGGDVDDGRCAVDEARTGAAVDAPRPPSAGASEGGRGVGRPILGMDLPQVCACVGAVYSTTMTLCMPSIACGMPLSGSVIQQITA